MVRGKSEFSGEVLREGRQGHDDGEEMVFKER